MSIRMVAVDLYRVMKQVERLEKELEDLPETASDKREDSKKKLAHARIEKDRLKRMMEGAKGD